MEKKCSKCKVNKPVGEIYTNGYCKVCQSIYRKKYYKKNKETELISHKKYREINKDYHKNYYSTLKDLWKSKYSITSKKYYLDNKDIILNKQKDYRQTDNYKNKQSIYKKDYVIKNKERINKYANNYIKYKYDTDPNFKIRILLRSRLYSVLKGKGIRKTQRTLDLLGCHVTELKSYLESMFLPTMSWENHGIIWHIDHIIPCSSFDLTLIESQKKCFHYTNLQPLFITTRIIDGVQYIGNLNKSNKS
jgi:hypothetical protein